MNNPFSKHERRQLSNASIIGKFLGIAARIPPFFLWLLSCLIPPAVRDWFARLWAFMMAPFTRPIEWFKVWLLTRAWKRILWAAPFVVLVFVFSSFYIFYENTAKIELFDNQLRKVSGALYSGNFAKADFQLSHLITVEELSNRPEILFQAMIAASRVGSEEKAIELETRLKRDHVYAPAMRMSALQLMERARPGSSEYEEGLRMLWKAAERAATAENRDANWSLYIERAIQSSRFTDAVEAYQRIEGFEPRASLRVVEVLNQLGRAEEAIKILNDTRDQLNTTEPGEFLVEKVGVRVIASSSYESEGLRINELKEAKTVLDLGLGYITDDEIYRQVNLQANHWLIRDLLKLKSQEAIRLAFLCMDDLLQSYEGTSSLIGFEAIVLDLSNPMRGISIPNDYWKANLADGLGVSIWHVMSGFSAWANSEELRAQRHFQIAIKSTPQSASLIRSIIYIIAVEESKAVQGWLEYANPRSFLKLGRNRGELSLAMLDQLGGLEQPASYATLSLIARLKANERDWSGAIDTIVSQLDRFEGDERTELVQVLVVCYNNSGRLEEARKLIAAERAASEVVAPAPGAE